MLIEYIGLGGIGDSALTSEFVYEVVIIVLTGLAFTLIGFKIRGVWGAVIALMSGVVYFLFNEGIVRF